MWRGCEESLRVIKALPSLNWSETDPVKGHSAPITILSGAHFFATLQLRCSMWKHAVSLKSTVSAPSGVLRPGEVIRDVQLVVLSTIVISRSQWLSLLFLSMLCTRLLSPQTVSCCFQQHNSDIQNCYQEPSKDLLLLSAVLFKRPHNECILFKSASIFLA